MTILFYCGLALTLLSIFGLLATLFLQPSPGARRMLEVVQSTRADARRIGPKERAVQALLGLARSLRLALGLADDPRLKQRLVSAGLRADRRTEIYFAARLLAPLAGIAAGSFIRGNPVVACLVLGFVGYLVPDIWLSRMVQRRRRRIQRGIPDAIDLMVICVDAGLGLDQALLRVGQELALSQPALSEEFLRVNLEQRAGKPRLEAWQTMAARTLIPEFAALVNMLVQTDRFGTPIIRALSRFAEEMRLKRRQRAEEAAAKTKIKILFPLVLFIFPSVFIVLLGPAVLNMMKSFNAFK